MEPLTIIGGGLAGSEAAWQVAQRGIPVRLYEMRPTCSTLAHKTEYLAEIVCSNSFKSNQIGSAPWLLKQELKQLDSLLLQFANEHQVPSGAALSVDRNNFSLAVTQRLESVPNIQIIRQEVSTLPSKGPIIIATGPLTSTRLSDSLKGFMGEDHLYFYDAISPIVDADSINYSKVYQGSRYENGGADYLNCSLNKQEYLNFYSALVNAESVPLHECEKHLYFEACLPIEEMARRGIDTLRFGPMKPVGLIDPRTQQRPYAAVQLRQENLKADSYNIVGFQNHLRFGEQEKLFRLIPGLEEAHFLRLGQVHRNTFINAPRQISSTLQSLKRHDVFFAGQLSGVEGYVECIATGLVAGINASYLALGKPLLTFPRASAIGSLIHYLVNAPPENFQPENINFGILPSIERSTGKVKLGKKERRKLQIKMALQEMSCFARELS
ncbi:MAG: methylenetetrahydrofolate--tRNA-(uracil(54)-C(5))-methyltransferase (FADH(2)-oxidizing) TrmFO [Acidobacteriia bacterium]|nr:methylenetetrahydrofolate--tRNA-(uracil(54)-C(5))-methyltransferase (FADH(2)-oxidizing) TrmFO [Terriglobia bacterium]